MQRVSVVGTSGSGKSTTARWLAAKLGVPHVELDASFHQARWQPLPLDEYRARVEAVATTKGWVIDGNYSAVRDLVLARADTVVWLDLPRALVMRRIIGRTIRRALTREVLWNGNREPLSNLCRWDPQKNVIRWAWTRHPLDGARLEAAIVDPALAHLHFVRLRSQREIDAFVAASS